MSASRPGSEVMLAGMGVVSSFTDHSVAGNASRVCGQSGASGAWPAANRALYVPVSIANPFVIEFFWTYNGSTASGNRDIGIYDYAGNRLQNTGSVAQSGTSTIQTHSVTATEYPPGVYFLAIVHSDATGTYFRITQSLNGLRMCGVRQEALGSTALPSTFTGSLPASSYLPVFGIGQRSVL